MKKRSRKARPRTVRERNADTMRPVYDFSAARRGVTAKRYATGSNVVVLDPDVSQAFPTAEAVNDALRELIEIADRRVRVRRKGRKR
jgi:hypothetical protein